MRWSNEVGAGAIASSEWEAGAAAMREFIAAWHERNGRIFADLVKQLERDRAAAADIQRARWAAASHHAHAAFVRRIRLPVADG